MEAQGGSDCPQPGSRPSLPDTLAWPGTSTLPSSQAPRTTAGAWGTVPGVLETPLFLPQMWKFTQSRWVVRKEVAAVTKVSGALLDLRPGPTTAGMGAEWGWACLTWPPPRSSAQKT